MTRVNWTALTLLAAWLVFAAPSLRAADKEVTLKGKLMCAKCELQETKKCQTVIKVKEGNKEITYYFLDKGAAEEYHEPVCGSGQKEGNVTGVVSEKEGKKWITPKKVAYTGEKKQGAMESPHWLGDYGIAREQGQKAKKPLAVVIASGDAGWNKLAREGVLGEEVLHRLAVLYVCVYLDTATQEGRRLASAFEMPAGTGLVLSDQTGRFENCRHQGPLANHDLAQCLQRHGGPMERAGALARHQGGHEPHATPLLGRPVQPVSSGGAFAPAGGGGCCGRR